MPVLDIEQLSGLDAWLRAILWDSKLPNLNLTGNRESENKPEIHRLKARLPLSNGDVKIVQGVRDVFEILDAPNSNDSMHTLSEGKIVVIGRYLTGLKFEESFRNTVNL